MNISWWLRINTTSWCISAQLGNSIVAVGVISIRDYLLWSEIGTIEARCFTLFFFSKAFVTVHIKGRGTGNVGLRCCWFNFITNNNGCWRLALLHCYFQANTNTQALRVAGPQPSVHVTFEPMFQSTEGTYLLLYDSACTRISAVYTWPSNHLWSSS